MGKKEEEGKDKEEVACQGAAREEVEEGIVEAGEEGVSAVMLVSCGVPWRNWTGIWRWQDRFTREKKKKRR